MKIKFPWRLQIHDDKDDDKVAEIKMVVSFSKFFEKNENSFIKVVTNCGYFNDKQTLHLNIDDFKNAVFLLRTSGNTCTT